MTASENTPHGVTLKPGGHKPPHGPSVLRNSAQPGLKNPTLPTFTAVADLSVTRHCGKPLSQKDRRGNPIGNRLSGEGALPTDGNLRLRKADVSVKSCGYPTPKTNGQQLFLGERERRFVPRSNSSGTGGPAKALNWRQRALIVTISPLSLPGVPRRRPCSKRSPSKVAAFVYIGYNKSGPSVRGTPGG